MATMLLLLPDDVLLQILGELEWATLIGAVRGTCSELNALTHSRILWIRLYQRYRLESAVPFRLEAPVEDYSSSQLQRLVLSRIGADIAFLKGAHMRCPARQRSIDLSDVSNVPFLTGHLIDGGRWLIALNEDGWLFCWDLDADDVATTCTILATATTGFQEDIEPNAVSSLQIIEGTEQLAFRFALVVSIQDWDTWSYKYAIYLWECSLVVDEEHPRGSFAVYELLQTVSPNHRNGAAYLSLRDDLLAIQDSEGTYVEIHDWRDLLAGELASHKVVSLPTMPDSIRLLPGNELLIAKSYSGGVFELDRLTSTLERPILVDDLAHTATSQMSSDDDPHDYEGSTERWNCTSTTTATALASPRLTKGLDYRLVTYNPTVVHPLRRFAWTDRPSFLDEKAVVPEAFLGRYRGFVYFDDPGRPRALLLDYTPFGRAPEATQSSEGDARPDMVAQEIHWAGPGLSGGKVQNIFFDEASGRVVIYSILRDKDEAALRLMVSDYSQYYLGM